MPGPIGHRLSRERSCVLATLRRLYALAERSLIEQLQCNLLFRWFVGLDLDAPVGCDRVHQELGSLIGG